jgi:hypothetical protein
MKLTESTLREIIKEELVKEMDVGTGLAVVGGALIAWKALGFLLAIGKGLKAGWQAGSDEVKFNLKAGMGLMEKPEIKEILRKFKDINDPTNKKIFHSLMTGKLDEAAKLLEDSGKVTPEELQILQKDIKTLKGLKNTHSMVTKMKYGIK